MVMSSKWMRLIGLVGFTAVLVSCKQTPPDFITFLRHHIAHNDNQRVT